MEGSAKQKVPGGKLLSIKVSYSQKIESVKIMGDFFLYPESSLKLIEDSLIGFDMDKDLSKIASKVSEVILDNNIELLGITPQSIEQTIKIAVGK